VPCAGRDAHRGRSENTVAVEEAGSSGDGGPATSARLDGPQGLAFDASTNFYISEFPGSRVRKVDATGMITTVARGSTIPHPPFRLSPIDA